MHFKDGEMEMSINLNLFPNILGTSKKSRKKMDQKGPKLDKKQFYRQNVIIARKDESILLFY